MVHDTTLYRPNMSAPFSLVLDPELKDRLDEEARSQERPAAYLAAKAIRFFLDAQDAKRSAIGRAIAEADSGNFVSADAVHRWMESWDSADELPPPGADIDLIRP